MSCWVAKLCCEVSETKPTWFQKEMGLNLQVSVSVAIKYDYMGEVCN